MAFGWTLNANLSVLTGYISEIEHRTELSSTPTERGKDWRKFLDYFHLGSVLVPPGVTFRGSTYEVIFASQNDSPVQKNSHFLLQKSTMGNALLGSLLSNE